MGIEQRFDGKAFARTLTEKSGVYRLLRSDGTVIYIGKARNLRKRLSSYFQSPKQHSPKIRSMLSQVAAIEVTVTHTENEALILENNLIKELKPRYNVVLRDDKSYPYIHLSSAQEFPRLSFHRGARTGKGRYFGPYPSAGAVRSTLNLLQKLFMIRQCEDSFFHHRTRPCLQYQIKRCTAPCVGLIDSRSYRDDVQHAEMFLQGRNQEVIDVLVKRMESASETLEFERAARYRDQINALQRVQQKQYVSSESGDIDIVACVARDGVGCVQVFFIRGGHNLGNKTFFPQHTRGAAAADILAAFIPQYYLANRVERAVPSEILINQSLEDLSLLSQVLSSKANRKVTVQPAIRGERTRWLRMAVENAELALSHRLCSHANQFQRMEALRDVLDLDESIERIECFDISHIHGEATVASCVVFSPQGPMKEDYRRFNVDGIEPGDDYAAIRQAINRRYTRVKREDGKLPDLLLIDGGKGQVQQAKEVMESLQITDLCIIGVAKGPSRKPGLETLILTDARKELRLTPDAAALHLIQQIRDEAHRFAITGHRSKRAKSRNTSVLEQISGIGSARRRRLIQHFGGLHGVARAGIEDLSKVPGISSELAQKIYASLHGSV